MALRTRYPGMRPPAPATIAAAPLLDEWTLVREGEEGLLLVGRREDGREIQTSTLQMVDMEAGWAWAYSGAYRLGRPRALPLDLDLPDPLVL